MIGAIKRRWKSKKAKVLLSSSSSESCPTSRGFTVDEEFEKTIKPPSPRQIHPVDENVEFKFGSSKSSTLPPHKSPEVPPFIRVNSGRIELISTHCTKIPTPKYVLPSPPNLEREEELSAKLKKRLGGRFKNDIRHSWSGSPPPHSDGNTPSNCPHEKPKICPLNPTFSQISQKIDDEDTYSDPIEEKEILKLKTSLLTDRLEIIENLTQNYRNLENEEKKEQEKCMAELATEVGKAVQFQKVMKGEVERLQQRIVELERHNRAMATMIVPTLMKLHDTVGVGHEKKGRRQIEQDDESSESSSKNSPQNSQSQSTNQHNLNNNLMINSDSKLTKKTDCRIPRMRQSNSKTTVENNSKSDKSLKNDGISSPTKLPPKSCKNSTNNNIPTRSRSSTNVLITNKTKSSTYSGIPRISSPSSNRRIKEDVERKTSLPPPPKSRILTKTSPKNSNFSEPNSASSKLPVRKNNLLPMPTKCKNLTSAVSKVPILKKPKDEGYSTMSSEALAEQEGASENSPSLLNNSSTLTKSRTFNSFTLLERTRAESMSDESKNVQIIRGFPIEAKEMNNSEQKVLWEDSDDSDILFMPVNSYLAPEGKNEEKALIEKWMRLEDVRNQVQAEDEWAWDWDGVERTHPTYFEQLTKLNKVIDSSTWTKKKNNHSSSADQSQIKTDKHIYFDTHDEKLEDIRGSAHQTQNNTTQSISHEEKLEVRENEEQINYINLINDNNELNEDLLGSNVDESSIPPTTNFTPEYYRLVKYGSNNSVTDRELLPFTSSSSNYNSHLRTDKNSCYLESSIKNKSEFGTNYNSCQMDDKINQTDFEMSSSENLNISSELFTECRNCLELIKKLVGGIEEDGTHFNNCTIERKWEFEDNGEPTTWISVPKGVEVEEMGRVLEILSSSESDDVLGAVSSPHY